MPIPSPNKNEKREDFISRCMSNDVMKHEFSSNLQRVAVCQQVWKDAHKKTNKK